MKKLILLAFVIGGLAGMVVTYRWLRGDTAFEDAVRELDAEQDFRPSASSGDATG